MVLFNLLLMFVIQLNIIMSLEIRPLRRLHPVKMRAAVMMMTILLRMHTKYKTTHQEMTLEKTMQLTMMTTTTMILTSLKVTDASWKGIGHGCSHNHNPCFPTAMPPCCFTKITTMIMRGTSCSDQIRFLKNMVVVGGVVANNTSIPLQVVAMATRP
eukprot:PhF_6_TR22347/c0_g1_i3/m.31648